MSVGVASRHALLHYVFDEGRGRFGRSGLSWLMDALPGIRPIVQGPLDSRSDHLTNSVLQWLSHSRSLLPLSR